MQTKFKNDFSKGGLAGAIMGAVISTQTHKPSESVTRKTMKTGLFAALGYAVGAFIENLFSRNTESSHKQA